MKTILLFVFIVCCGIYPIYGQPSYGERLDEFFTFHEKDHAFTGSVLIAKKGEVLWQKGYGLQNVASGKRNTDHTQYPIYSITKIFSATLILKLVEEGRLALSDRLSHFYPDFPQGDSISIAHLLSHTAGIFEFTSAGEEIDPHEAAFVKYLMQKPLDFSPGSSWSYSNSGYYLLGFIIERICGIPYEEAVAQYIFKPLGMTQSGFAFKYLQSDHKATGFERYNAKEKLEAIVYEPPGPYAAGGIYSTVEDLYKFHVGLLEGKILSDTMLNMAQQTNENRYGYGWLIREVFGKQTLGHSGGGAGFRTDFIWIPADDIFVTLLSNDEKDLLNIFDVMWRIIYDRPTRLPEPISVTDEQLRPYEGQYDAGNGLVIHVFLEEGQLIAQPGENRKTILYVEGENQFYVEELNAAVHFEFSSTKTTTCLVLEMEDRTVRAIRN